ncbi:hypothetical protein IWW34DRAFT_751191 [Fusarium oxysporum f. sp. albedinis]|nr:hypothetical protein IWW34DRAFT_751191 [Fusarium oxysporum f. sp. albedinis]
MQSPSISTTPDNSIGISLASPFILGVSFFQHVRHGMLVLSCLPVMSLGGNITRWGIALARGADWRCACLAVI